MILAPKVRYSKIKQGDYLFGKTNLWGTASPIKAMGPAKAVMLPAKNTGGKYDDKP
jgi:hypothetical protein